MYIHPNREFHGYLHGQERQGMALNLNDMWEECQLSLDLEIDVNKYRDNVNGYPVTMDHDLEGGGTGTDTDS